MLKRTSKVTILLLFLGTICSICGCSKKSGSKINGFTMEELKKKDAVMFEAKDENWKLVSDADNHWSENTYRVNYNGTIQVVIAYNLSGNVVDETFDLSEDDYNSIIHYLDEEFKENSYKEPEACDGDGWYLTYYDTQGNILEEYSGYTYDIKPIEEIQEILKSYIPEYEKPEI